MPIAGKAKGWLDWRSWVLGLAGALWLLVVAAFALVLVTLAVGGCEAPPPRDSSYGELSWSYLPPGPVCTFTQEQNGVDLVEGPWPYTIAGEALLATGAFLIIAAVRMGRASPAHDRHKMTT